LRGPPPYGPEGPYPPLDFGPPMYVPDAYYHPQPYIGADARRMMREEREY
tara:strand:+ start:570 stop:719 length:150 start_codon:yes stop_codon:yes gene_type:complete